MAERPLLFFPSKEIAQRSRLHGGPGKNHLPTRRRQDERLSPKFTELQRVLNSQALSLQQTSTGIIPEYVLVFETIGSVEQFANAVARVDGFEWLGELELDEIQPDSDFYALNDQDEIIEGKTLNGRLYLISTNTQAMDQLLALWKRYLYKSEERFERGLGKFKDVFKLLKDIRKWDVQDRFEETNILKLWEENLQLFPDRVVRFEIELWYKSNSSIRTQNYNSVKAIIEKNGGKIIYSTDISEICYHAILVELPAVEINKILNHNNTELIKCDSIMFFKPSGQVIAGEVPLIDMESIQINHDEEHPTGEPIIGIFDGYPLAKHDVLDERLIIDDPDNYESYYRVEDRKHGTAMCSLIVRGDLNESGRNISRPLYVRPIMRPNEDHPKRIEFVPNDTLLVDTVHRAVKRIFEGENNESAIAPSIKIINLSVCDNDRIFLYSMSPWAKLLDWLSFKYKVLFVVSTGNYVQNISLPCTRGEFEALNQLEKEKLFVREIKNNSHYNRIMSPSESINCLTIGASHTDNAVIRVSEQRINPFSCFFPGSYSAFGGGFRKSIKPDFVFNGGRLFYDYSYVSNTLLTPTPYTVPPGIKVAAPDSTLNKTIYDVGTSIAAALITRNGYFFYEIIENLISDHGLNIDRINIPLLIKAMLAHGCSWESIGDEIEKRIDITDNRTKKILKSKWIGYGYPNLDKVKECTEQRATVIGFGELKQEEAHVYYLPLPPSLVSKTVYRKLTITLAWFSPISPRTQRYRTSRLWFEANNSIASQRINTDDKAVRRGTLQHEIFEGNSAEAFIDGASIRIKVNCSDDALISTIPIQYAIIVSFEVKENINIPIYQEIKDRITIPVAINQYV